MVIQFISFERDVFYFLDTKEMYKSFVYVNKQFQCRFCKIQLINKQFAIHNLT